VSVVDGGGGGECLLFVDDTQIKRWCLPTLDLGVVVHSTNSADSVPA
jgi:hypothetical protein